jgi:hypothetical protein
MQAKICIHGLCRFRALFRFVQFIVLYGGATTLLLSVFWSQKNPQTLSNTNVYWPMLRIHWPEEESAVKEISGENVTSQFEQCSEEERFSLGRLFVPCRLERNVNDPIIFTLANNVGSDGGLCRFLEGVIWNDFNRVIVLGWADPPENSTSIPQLDGTEQWFFGGRHTMVSMFLDRYNVSDNQLVIGVDSFDVLVQESMSTVTSKYKEMSAPLQSKEFEEFSEREFGCGTTPCAPLFYATENDCWPPSFQESYDAYYAALHDAWPSAPTNTTLLRPPSARTYRYLNGGGYIGPAAVLRRVLREVRAGRAAVGPRRPASARADPRPLRRRSSPTSPPTPPMSSLTTT